MEIKTEFELEDEEEIVKTVYESIKEETKMEDKALEGEKRRSFVEITRKGNKLCVRIGSDEIIGARAAANTWLRLLKIAEEMTHMVKECDPHAF